MKPVNKKFLFLILFSFPLMLACLLPHTLAEQVRIFFAIPIMVDETSATATPQSVEGEITPTSQSVTTAGEDQSVPDSENEPFWGFESDAAVTPWSIEQCNAVSDFSITATDFSEEVFNSGAKKCEFRYSMFYSGDHPAHIFLYLYYSKNGEVPDNTAVGWVRGGDPEPGDVRFANNHFSSNPLGDLELFIDTAYSVVFTYDVPECQWVTRGGIHQEILEIQNVDLLQTNFPCSEFNFDAVSISPGEMEKGLVDQ